MKTFTCYAATILPFFFLGLSSCRRHPSPATQWEVYGGGKENRHYSALAQIDTDNVGQLTLAWEYHTHDADSTTTQIQVNGIESEGVFYGVSPRLKLFALDAASGQQKWSFDPATQAAKVPFAVSACRGVTLYGKGKADERLFYSAGSLLYCIDTHTGKPVSGFGHGGSVDLHDGLDKDVKDLYVVSTTPGILYKDLLIVGTRVAESTPAAPGSIRAYDVHTGERKWIFHTIPWPGEAGYESWNDTTAYRYAGGANTWAGFSMDEEKGILFAPTGSASFDFYGGNRTGNDLYANCILAIDAATGKRIWHFQTVHHDLWDRDLPTPPVLVTLTKDGQPREALAQITKSGYIFLLDRRTGTPLYPVTETPVPHESELAGEQPSPTQPVPSLPLPFARQSLSISNLNHLVSDSSYADIVRRLSGYKTGNMFNPPSKEGTVIFPGFDGGGEWGGPSFDPATGLLYINASEMPWVLTMVEVKAAALQSNAKASSATGRQTEAGPPPLPTNEMEGKSLYAVNCMGCHGPQRQGGGNYPSLIGAGKKYNEEQFKALIESGRRMMPGFKQLTGPEKRALASFVLEIHSLQKEKYVALPQEENAYDRLRYTSTGYNKFLTKEGYPAVAPPWGTLTAVDLNTGKVVWKDTLGDYPEWKAKGIHTGTENYGGSVVTAGGLLFIAATRDAKIRGFNKRTGQLLWEAALPAAGFATPSVYEADGRTFLVIACGGGKLKTPSGDSYVAFSLPTAH